MPTTRKARKSTAIAPIAAPANENATPAVIEEPAAEPARAASTELIAVEAVALALATADTPIEGETIEAAPLATEAAQLDTESAPPAVTESPATDAQPEAVPETARLAAEEATAEPEAAVATLMPTPERAAKRNESPISITAISFSLTFVGVSLAFLAGLLPPPLASISMPVDLGVLLLVVPLCALVVAMMGEVLRTALRGVPSARAPRLAPALSNWTPGHGEG